MPGSVHELCDVQQKVGEEKVRLHFADGKTRPRGIGASTALSPGRRPCFLPFEVLWFDSAARKRKRDDLRVSSVRFALSRRRETTVVRQGSQQIFHRQTFRQDRVHAPQPSPSTHFEISPLLSTTRCRAVADNIENQAKVDGFSGQWYAATITASI